MGTEENAMADGKWIDELHPDLPLLEAARHVLHLRLAPVEQHFAGVLEHADEDPEHVHQLRVSTRRGDAAVRLFRTCLPRKVYKDARERLRRLRRAAGEARNWDVFALELLQPRRRTPASQQAGIDFLIGYARGERDAAQHPLDAAIEEQKDTYTDFVEAILDAVRPSDKFGQRASLLDLARATLKERHELLEQAAAADLNDYANLHQVRIAGKKLRYAMEVFATCFASEFREELYPKVEEVQEVLGRANDSHVASQRLAALRQRIEAQDEAEWKRLRAGFEAQQRLHQRRLPQERRLFLRWWRKWAGHGKVELMACLEAGPVAAASSTSA
jgi:CHAD domain-containing protein